MQPPLFSCINKLFKGPPMKDKYKYKSSKGGCGKGCGRAISNYFERKRQRIEYMKEDRQTRKLIKRSKELRLKIKEQERREAVMKDSSTTSKPDNISEENMMPTGSVGPDRTAVGCSRMTRIPATVLPQNDKQRPLGLSYKLHKKVVVGQDQLAVSSSSSSPASSYYNAIFCSQASDLGIQMARECYAKPSETFDKEATKQIAGASDHPSNVGEEVSNSLIGVSDRGIDVIAQNTKAVTAPKGKRHKGKNAQASSLSPLSSPIAYGSSDSIKEQAVHADILSEATVSSQIHSIQENNNLSQLLPVLKEMQKQAVTNVASPIIKEYKGLEATIGQIIEKAVKANSVALWARFQDYNVKNEKVMKHGWNEITKSVTRLVNKDMVLLIEETVKKELASAVPSLVEAPPDPTKELSRLLSEHKYEEAFTAALQRSNLTVVSWLCSQVDLQKLLSSTPVPLSQGVLLSPAAARVRHSHRYTNKIGLDDRCCSCHYTNDRHASLSRFIRF